MAQSFFPGWEAAERDISARKHQGNPLSEEAFERLRPSLPAQRAAVLEYIRSRGELGATSKEVAGYLARALNCISGRLSELKRDGDIVGTERRRDGCQVWIVKD